MISVIGAASSTENSFLSLLEIDAKCVAMASALSCLFSPSNYSTEISPEF